MSHAKLLLPMAALALSLAAAPVAGQLDSEGSSPRTPVPSDKSKSPAAPKLDNPKDVFGPANKSGGDKTTDAKSWTIVLAVFRGDDQTDLAKLGLNKVGVEGGLPDAFIEKRGQSTVVSYGRFSANDAPEVAAELKRVQEIEVRAADGSPQKPYRYAMLAPPIDKPDAGTLTQYNLSQARVLFGDNALYTLQVGVYGREDLNQPKEKDLIEVRKAAEQAALRLRQEGEQAFYHHGPRRSMVTIGVFDLEDFDPSAPTFKSTRLRDAERRHPHNLYNGAGIKERRKGEKEGRLQDSTLVAIPKAK